MSDWTCRGTGACCRTTETVQVSGSELALLERARPDVVPVVVRYGDRDRLEIAAGPCPYLGPDDRCTVYAVRPWRCRVWGCFRTEAQYQQPFETGVFPLRVQASAGVRRVFAGMVAEAQAWGQTHGWVDGHGDLL